MFWPTATALLLLSVSTAAADQCVVDASAVGQDVACRPGRSASLIQTKTYTVERADQATELDAEAEAHTAEKAGEAAGLLLDLMTAGEKTRLATLGKAALMAVHSSRMGGAGMVMVFVACGVLLALLAYCVGGRGRAQAGEGDGKQKLDQKKGTQAPPSPNMLGRSNVRDSRLSIRPSMPTQREAIFGTFCPELMVPADTVCQLVVPLGAWNKKVSPIDVCGQDGYPIVKVVRQDITIVLQAPSGEILADCRKSSPNQFDIYDRDGAKHATLSGGNGQYQLSLPRWNTVYCRGNFKDFDIEMTDGSGYCFARSEKCAADFDTWGKDVYFGVIMGSGVDVGILMSGMLCALTLSSQG